MRLRLQGGTMSDSIQQKLNGLSPVERLKATDKYLAEMRDIPPRLLGAADDLECGRMEEEEFYSLVCRELNIPGIDEVREWFYSILGDEMPGIADTLNRIKNDWDFVFLSDISGAHLQLVAEKLSFFNMAAGGIYSFEVGAKKPAREMYLAFERKFGKPDLYVDDRTQNIQNCDAMKE